VQKAILQGLESKTRTKTFHAFYSVEGMFLLASSNSLLDAAIVKLEKALPARELGLLLYKFG
jgi:hypothetical protein